MDDERRNTQSPGRLLARLNTTQPTTKPDDQTCLGKKQFVTRFRGVLFVLASTTTLPSLPPQAPLSTVSLKPASYDVIFPSLFGCFWCEDKDHSTNAWIPWDKSLYGNITVVQ